MATYIVINKETLTIPFRHSEFRAASEAADLVCPNHTSRISELNNAAFSCFTEYELMVIYKNITGEPITIRPYAELLKAVRYAAEEKIPVDPTPYETIRQSVIAAFPDLTPEERRPLPPANPSPPPLPAFLGGSDQSQGETPKKEKPPAQPKDPSASSSDNQRPKPGGKTARVWEIADNVLKANHEGMTEDITPAKWKDIRSRIVALTEEEGLNPGMVGTQYGRWKKSILGS